MEHSELWNEIEALGAEYARTTTHEYLTPAEISTEHYAFEDRTGAPTEEIAGIFDVAFKRGWAMVRGNNSIA